VSLVLSEVVNVFVGIRKKRVLVSSERLNVRLNVCWVVGIRNRVFSFERGGEREFQLCGVVGIRKRVSSSERNGKRDTEFLWGCSDRETCLWFSAGGGACL